MGKITAATFIHLHSDESDKNKKKAYLDLLNIMGDATFDTDKQSWNIVTVLPPNSPVPIKVSYDPLNSIDGE